jgi:uncharacterized protein involved in exopolysaccharide biosynthesis
VSERGRLELEKQQLDSTLQQLRARYSERYPDVVKAQHQLDAVNLRLDGQPSATEVPASKSRPEATATAVRLEVIERQMRQAKADQDRIQRQIASYQGKIDATPLREQQLVELTRNYDISKQHYQALLDKSFNIGMAANLEQKQKGERFTVLDPARVPEKPIKPRRKLLIPLAWVCALAVSTVWVVGKEGVNPAIKGETELKGMLPKGVRVVGLIPSIRTAADEEKEHRDMVIAIVSSLAMCLVIGGLIWHIRLVL